MKRIVTVLPMLTVNLTYAVDVNIKVLFRRLLNMTIATLCMSTVFICGRELMFYIFPSVFDVFVSYLCIVQCGKMSYLNVIVDL